MPQFLTVAQIEGVAQIVTSLAALAITGFDAIRRAISAVKGPAMTEDELNAIAKWIENDATFREALARAEAAGQ